MHVRRGFTLIEIVVGLVLFSIVLLTVTTLIAPQVRRGVDPIWQVRAAELAQSLMNEISAKSFDEASNRGGGMTRCNEGTDCTPSASLGPDAGESRDIFDDVDDYHGLNQSGAAILNTLGNQLSAEGVSLYAGFTAQVSVFYDDNVDGVNDDDTDGDGTLDSGTYVGNTKLISVTITTPGGERLAFSRLRSNF
ncbi:type IV pilus modification PilV family protein [Aestuariibacter salexigens]|uniref:type IV pilus modification PilV family protein n=1 Tax=Aestuariibacter salexigens TaxID=226010 RepID=UPI000406F9DA|nr:prepilin-type N-terminal cleavage/methylation domain-containing protein [Aestuariibacter salexigens]